ncbi:MAG: DKNYY domain-containing protein [Pseudomonadota bacterium]|nr:DKNYY domain-containing protein [Pseudomonadota bacterium]
MGLLGNILVTFALIFWPMVWIVSIMGMGGPGASNNLSWMLQLLLFNSYPIWIFAVLSYTGSTYWGLNSHYFLLGIAALFLVLNVGLIYSVYNLVVRGINNEGYSVAGDTVYWNAKPLADAEPGSFSPIVEKLAFDENRFYDAGRVLETTADPASFRLINDLYYRDDKQVFYVPYHEIKLVEGADASTFEVVEETSNDVKSDARDTYFRYYSGERVAPR